MVSMLMRINLFGTMNIDDDNNLVYHKKELFSYCYLSFKNTDYTHKSTLSIHHPSVHACLITSVTILTILNSVPNYDLVQ